jgi:shikimate dehydrogenase
MSDRYAVMGNPIKHSKSPQIHADFADQTGQKLNYEAMLVEEGHFNASVQAFFTAGGKGLNITVPFKQQAWTLADCRTPRAELAGAVNTLYRDELGRLWGDNTDGAGLVRDILHNHQGSIAGKRVLILGAGGAVRGLLAPLLEQQPALVWIANRTQSRAEQLAKDFGHLGALKASGFADLHGLQFDMVINGTAASLQGELPPLPDDLLHRGAWCYDMMYAAEPTLFSRWAMAHGAAVALDGLGMLVEQAAESFLRWRRVEPVTAPVIARIRTQLSG